MPVIPQNVPSIQSPQPSSRGPEWVISPNDCIEALRWITLGLQHHTEYWSNSLQFIVAYFILKEMH